MILRKSLVATAFAAAIPGALAAEQAMLVLDASGSMWGRIDGRAKITIAREAVRTMLDDWNPSVELGLVAYGHRRKGDCTDIEVLAPPTPVDAAAFAARVDRITPVGKTPISAAVRLAAETLRSNEQKATVILVSDGLETCHANPCALADELEASGVDFTAHVIGFDVAGDSEAGRQLACLAERTGGRYLEAERADQLGAALRTIRESIAAAEPQAAQHPGAPTEGCLFFDDDGYSGEWMRPDVGTPVEYIGDEWNDRVRSARCAPGCRARLWLHADFHSKYVDARGDTPNLGDVSGSVSGYHVACGDTPLHRPE